MTTAHPVTSAHIKKPTSTYPKQGPQSYPIQKVQGGSWKVDMGSCQHRGPFLRTRNIRRCTILGIQKAIIISTITHIPKDGLLLLGPTLSPKPRSLLGVSVPLDRPREQRSSPDSFRSGKFCSFSEHGTFLLSVVLLGIWGYPRKMMPFLFWEGRGVPLPRSRRRWV